MKSLLSCLIILSAPIMAEPLIIAHRGASHAAPENTHAAFDLAWKEGADGIEGDFRLTTDGRIVALHDRDFQRSAGDPRKVAECSWPEIRDLDVGSWKDPRFANERPPLLDDVLRRLPEDKLIFIEIKCGPEVVEPLAKLLADQQADPARVFVISFHEEVVAATRKRLPEFPSHLVSTLSDERGPTPADFEPQLIRCDATGLQFKHSAPVTSDWLASLHHRGLMLASWTVDDPADARRVRALGVDFITTNRPAFLRRALSE